MKETKHYNVTLIISLIVLFFIKLLLSEYINWISLGYYLVFLVLLIININKKNIVLFASTIIFYSAFNQQITDCYAYYYSNIFPNVFGLLPLVILLLFSVFDFETKKSINIITATTFFAGGLSAFRIIGIGTIIVNGLISLLVYIVANSLVSFYVINNYKNIKEMIKKENKEEINSNNMISKLKQLSDLKDSNIIDDQELKRLKEKIMKNE